VKPTSNVTFQLLENTTHSLLNAVTINLAKIINQFPRTRILKTKVRYISSFIALINRFNLKRDKKHRILKI